MSVIACGFTTRGVASVPVGRKFAVIASGFDVWISISANAAGDAARHCGFALTKVGVPYIAFIGTGSPPQFISGVTTDPNGDVTPTTLTYIDSGAAPF